MEIPQDYALQNAAIIAALFLIIVWWFMKNP